MPDLPDVTVILPTLNESAHIDETLGDLLDQEYPAKIEIVVADGGSKDGTREKLEEWAANDSRVRVVDNPRQRQAYGLNVAAAESTSDVLIRADGHTRYAPDYVATSVDALLELGGAVGGRMNPVGKSRLGKAVAAAMNSPLTMGPARFHHATEREEVDTVYLGAFRKSDFEAIGGFRNFPSGSSEDADFYYRWREKGLKVHVEPAVLSTYFPRDRIGQLWSQYWRYGLGKAEMLWLNGRFPSFRPLVPMALVLGLVAGLLLGALGGLWLPLAVLLGSWLVVLAVVAGASPEPGSLVVFVAAVMHLAYGLGVVAGTLRGPGPVRHLKGV